MCLCPWWEPAGPWKRKPWGPQKEARDSRATGINSGQQFALRVWTGQEDQYFYKSNLGQGRSSVPCGMAPTERKEGDSCYSLLSALAPQGSRPASFQPGVRQLESQSLTNTAKRDSGPKHTPQTCRMGRLPAGPGLSAGAGSLGKKRSRGPGSGDRLTGDWGIRVSVWTLSWDPGAASGMFEKLVGASWWRPGEPFSAVCTLFESKWELGRVLRS